MSKLDDMAAEVAADQAAIEGDLEDTRTRVIRMGKQLRKMQIEQKKEQQAAKERGEEPTTWVDWCDTKRSETDFFPGATRAKHYALISKYPKAYAKGMSIDQAYREAGKWKKNGGNPPDTEKKTVSRPLLLIQKTSSQLHRRVEAVCKQFAEDEHGSAGVAEKQKWEDDEIEGTRESLEETRKDCLMLIRQLDGIYEQA